MTGSAPAGPVVTGTALHDAWQARTEPPVEEVAAGVWSVPVPAADLPIRYTLCYLLLGSDRSVVVVDPGWDTDEGWAALVAGLSAAGRDVGDVIGVVVTHVHPDHHGLTARLVAAVEAAGGSAWMGMHADEAASLPSHFADDGASDVDWLRRNGVPEDVATEIGFGADDIHEFLAMPDPTVEIADGELLALPGRTVHALATPGHTPGHLCFYDEDNELLLTGDHILPRISPNVGMQPHSARPPLGPYLGSLRRLRVYDDAEVLPAHEWRFRGVAARIDTLLHHHDERCDEILGLLATSPATAWQLAERLTWSRGWDRITGMQRRAALSETIAHLAYLEEQGAVAERMPVPGAQAAQPVSYEIAATAST